MLILTMGITVNTLVVLWFFSAIPLYILLYIFLFIENRDREKNTFTTATVVSQQYQGFFCGKRCGKTHQKNHSGTVYHRIRAVFHGLTPTAAVFGMIRHTKTASKIPQMIDFKSKKPHFQVKIPHCFSVSPSMLFPFEFHALPIQPPLNQGKLSSAEKFQKRIHTLVSHFHTFQYTCFHAAHFRTSPKTSSDSSYSSQASGFGQ